MIKWSTSCLGILNGSDYVFAITQSRRGRSYAYFKWGNELIFFCTGLQTLANGEVVEYRPADDGVTSTGETDSPPYSIRPDTAIVNKSPQVMLSPA
ncbi:hypothetical protein A6456_37800 [Paraburkholderia tropica]|nr:hypothetical protein A6456_37800 [Paraburkholderia tropica]